jgi:hypothetical protein
VTKKVVGVFCAFSCAASAEQIEVIQTAAIKNENLFECVECNQSLFVGTNHEQLFEVGEQYERNVSREPKCL